MVMYEFRNKLENYLTNKFNADEPPNMAISYINGDNIVYSNGFGYRDSENSLPYNIQTLNRFGSCSKAFTSLAIMLLDHRDELSLQDPISKYLPIDLKTEFRSITIKHLLSHSSGMPDLGPPTSVSGSWDDFYNFINEAADEITHPPDKVFYYFNYGYTILGKILEVVSGQFYEQFIAKNIFRPLDMTKSKFLTSDISKESNFSSLHIQKSPVTKELNFQVPPFYKFLLGPGGIVSNVEEMSNFLIMQMNKGIYKNEQVFPASVINRSHRAHIDQNISITKASYGYGWELRELLGDKFIMHTGGLPGGFSYFGFLKNSKMGFVAISNVPSIPNHRILGGLAIIQRMDPDEEIPILKRIKHMNKLTGNYQIYRGLHKVFIEIKENQLLMRQEGTQNGRLLIPVGENPVTNFYYFFHSNGRRLYATFVKRGKKQYDLRINRNNYHKIINN